MNTLEILYQAFRVRYSLNQLQQILDRGCRLAILAPDASKAGTIREFLGPPLTGMDDRHPQDDLIELGWELGDADLKELRTCDACVVYFPDGPPEVEALETLAARIPLHIKTLWVCESEGQQAQAFHERDLTLPTVRSLPANQPGAHFLRLLLASLPQVSLVLARDWTLLREVFCQTLTRRTALRNGVRSGISSLPLRAVPVVGPVLAMLATSAETMMLTSSQLRLSFVIAAVHGRPLDFFDRISELWPIVGSAFAFRGASRALVRMLPGFGPGMKASIAFAGTFAVGEASRLFYHHGQPTSDEVRRELLRLSHEQGAREAQLLFRRILAGQSIDDVGVGGTEVIELVEGLTNVEQVFSDPIMGGAIDEARHHEEELLRAAVAEEVSREQAQVDDDASAELRIQESTDVEATPPAAEMDAVVVEQVTGVAHDSSEEVSEENFTQQSLESEPEVAARPSEKSAPSDATTASSAQDSENDTSAADAKSEASSTVKKTTKKTKSRGRKGKNSSDSSKGSEQKKP